MIPYYSLLFPIISWSYLQGAGRPIFLYNLAKSAALHIKMLENAQKCYSILEMLKNAIAFSKC